MNQIKLTVRHVVTADFRSTEATNIESEMKAHKLELGPKDAALFFSTMGNQVVFIKRPEEVELIGGRPHKLYCSMRLRLDGGSWFQNLPEFFLACERFGLDAAGLRGKVYDFCDANGIHIERKLRAVG